MKVITTDGTWLDADRIMGFDSKPLDCCDWMELICKYRGEKESNLLLFIGILCR